MKNYNAKKLSLNLVNSIHGSGIDCEWYVSENKKYILLTNSYHCMDENGYYEGYCDFTVKIDKKKAKVHNITFQTNSFYYRKYVPVIRDYLEQLFFDPYILPYKETPYYLREFNIK